MGVHNFPAAFELAASRPARYPLGLSVLIVVSMALAGWAGVGAIVYAVF